MTGNFKILAKALLPRCSLQPVYLPELNGKEQLISICKSSVLALFLLYLSIELELPETSSELLQELMCFNVVSTLFQSCELC